MRDLQTECSWFSEIRSLLAAEYKRTGFDRAAYNKKMNIKREGGDLYNILGD